MPAATTSTSGESGSGTSAQAYAAPPSATTPAIDSGRSAVATASRTTQVCTQASTRAPATSALPRATTTPRTSSARSATWSGPGRIRRISACGA